MGGQAERLEQEIRRYRPAFVVNQTRTMPDLKLGGFMSSAARRRLGHPFDYLGHVEADETVWLAARRRRSLVAEYPEGKASKNIERLGRRILSLDSERERERPSTTPLRLEEEQTYYEILETEPGVSDEEIRRAYRSIKDIYASGSLVVAGLYEDHELAELHARVNAAHDTLFSPERRRLYDLSLPEADLARAVRAASAIRRPPATTSATEERAEAAEASLDPAAEVTGAALRKLRESKGIELGEIAQRTKISERYLRAIEDEHFTDMPAAVYVRGLRDGIRARPARRHPAGDRKLFGALPSAAGETRRRRDRHLRIAPASGNRSPYHRTAPPGRTGSAGQKKAPSSVLKHWLGAVNNSRRRPTLPQSPPCSTIGPGGLNFRVRDGIGCGPSGKTAGKLLSSTAADDEFFSL